MQLRFKNGSCDCSYGCQVCLKWRQKYCKCGFWERCAFCESEADAKRFAKCGCIGFQRCESCTICDKCSYEIPCVKYFSKARKRELFRCAFCIECAFCGVPETKWDIVMSYDESTQAPTSKKYYWSYDMITCTGC